MVENEEFYSKEIYKKIKDDILNLRIKDGDFITLSELSKKYKVSKTPVRDALGALEIEGYLKSLPRKGYLVKPVTQKSIREAFQMRIVFEVGAAKIAIKAAENSELQNILKLAQEFPSEDIYSRDKLNLFNRLNNEFHMSIVKAAHNSLLVETGLNIMDNLSRILVSDSYNLDFVNEKNEHIDIAKALIERDAKRLEALISEHIMHLEKRVCSNNVGV
ncbi:GntR family transcriptional regulator [uncultured Clostridium sp.]|uniref:GntR family transcriptional regulator n=1 Tax=uncultured Clostridium sp. TaxID=59620 RepID=UPI0025D9060F|nr:GntR family transcriptional regulator [uncultured Clostridium sp.]